jgi:hypothetical protein
LTAPTPVNPLAVPPSSFEAKAAVDLPDYLVQVPALSNALNGSSGITSVPESLAIADFQQNGAYSAFAIATQGVQSKAYFVAKQGSSWTDLSASLIPNPDDRVVCQSPQQSVVADFNRDTRPDVYVACSGVGGVNQVIFLSQANGTYVKALASTWPAPVDANSVAVADIDNDTCKDVVTTDQGSLIIYKGHCGTGNTYSLVREDFRQPTNLPSNILSVFLAPNPSIPSRYDLVVGADATTQNYPVKWFANNGSGYFDNTSYREYGIKWGGSSNRYDYVADANYGYFYITNSMTKTFVKLARIVRPSTSLSTQVWYQTPGNTVRPVNDWPAYIHIRGLYLEPFDAGCGLSIVVDDNTRCGKRYLVSDFN